MKKKILLGTLFVTLLLVFTVCIPLFSAQPFTETDRKTTSQNRDTDPFLYDTDYDGFFHYQEYIAGIDPNNDNNSPCVNHPPHVPSNPNPSNKATGVDVNADLSWTGGDPDAGDIVTYDVFYGITNPPPKIISNQSGTTSVLPALAYNTRYYWKIVSWDNHGASTHGPIWSFVTMQAPNHPPNIPSNINPPNGTTGVDINADLSWTGGDPDVGDTVTYDVFFGTVSPPPKIANNQSGVSYNLPTLTYNTRYYWKIISWDNHGASTPGEISMFITMQQPNNPPYVPNNPNPANGTININVNIDLSWNGGDPDPGDTVTYDIIFAKLGDLVKVITNYPFETYDPEILEYNTTYYWSIISHDNHGAITNGPIWNFTTKQKEVINHPPTQPNLTGPTVGTKRVEYTFFTNATDPDGDQVLYNISWGDGNTSGWLGPYASGETIDVRHLWTALGIFDVTVKAKDIHDAESDWSTRIPINISYVKNIVINNIKLGYLYFRFFSDKSYAYIHLFEILNMSVILGFSLDVNASVSESVHSVRFNVTRLFTGEQTSMLDEDMTDGATAFFDLTTGFLSIAAHAYDINGSEIGNQTIDFVVFIKPNFVGGPGRHIGSVVQNHSAERVKI